MKRKLNKNEIKTQESVEKDVGEDDGDLGDIKEVNDENDSSDDEGLEFESNSDEDTEEESEDSEEENDPEFGGDGEEISESDSDSGTMISDDSESDIESDDGEENKANENKTKNVTDAKIKGKKLQGNQRTSTSKTTSSETTGVIKKGQTEDEYKDGDTSDEEDIRNTVGNIPKEWYDEYRHLGYDWDGKKILKPEKGDQLDYFLKQAEDPNFWRTVVDPQTGQDVVLSDKDIELVQRMLAHKVPDPDYDAYPEWIEWFSSEVMQMPLRKFPDHKRSFLPSKSEKEKVSKYVHALKMGWMKSSKMLKKEQKAKELAGPTYYMLWQSDEVAEEMRRIHNHIPAPKRQLPGNVESYNPPEEYLFNEREVGS